MFTRTTWAIWLTILGAAGLTSAQPAQSNPARPAKASANTAAGCTDIDYCNLTAALPGLVGHDEYSSLAIDGPVIVAGSPEADCPGMLNTYCGSAVVFRFTGSWMQEAVLSSPLPNPYLFGRSVAVTGDYVFVGEPEGSPGSTGAVRIFHYDGSAWNYDGSLTGAVPDGWFGTSLAADGDVLAVGAFREPCGATESCGAVHIYHRNGTAWELDTTLSPPVAAAVSLGWSVSLNGPVMVAGALGGSCGPGVMCGAAYVFRHNGSSWGFEQTLAPNAGEHLSWFGYAVHVQGDVCTVRRAHKNCPGGASNCGAAYAFRYAGGVWSQEAAFTDPDGDPDDELGTSVLTNGDAIWVGATKSTRPAFVRGSVRVYGYDGANWVHRLRLDPDFDDYKYFGTSLALDGSTFVVGGFRAYDPPFTATWVYDMTSSTDCDCDGVADDCAVAFKAVPDCNQNLQPDSCDIAGAVSVDCDGNGVPDECDLGLAGDCNHNGIVDGCESFADCNGNAVPDTCDVGGGSILHASAILGPTGQTAGRSLASGLGCFFNVPTTTHLTAVGGHLVGFGGSVTAYVVQGLPSTAPPTGPSVVASASFNPSSPSADVRVPLAATLAPGWYTLVLAGNAAMPLNNVPVPGASMLYWDDHEDLWWPSDDFLEVRFVIEGTESQDCNENGVPDECDSTQSTDCNANDVPDDCEFGTADCNNNGILDGCDIFTGASQDCSGNGVPNECEPDCNTNSSPDDCDLLAGTSEDCNANSIPDECDIASGVLPDVDGNGVPDTCEGPLPTLIWDFQSAATRSLRIAAQSPPEGPVLAALRVTMIDLQNPAPPNIGAFPPPNFGAFEDATCTAPGEAGSCERWVGPPFTFLEGIDVATSGTYKAARLQCSPYYHDWALLGEFAVIGAEIVPSSAYDVQAVSHNCMGNEAACTNVSPNARLTTRRSGDLAPNFEDGVPPLTQPDAMDVASVVNKFKMLPGAPVKSIAQVQPNLPDANGDINAMDIGTVVEAVKFYAYPFNGPCVCPSAVPCNTTACAAAGACAGLYGAGATCIRTCSAGPRSGAACTTNKHCGTCTPASSNAGAPCVSDSHCPGGTCTTGTCGTGFCRDRCSRCN